VTEPFALDAGTVVVHVTAEGNGPLVVLVWDAPGTGKGADAPPGDVVRRYGPYDGSIANRVLSTGEYIVSVEHDGPWSVTIEQ
jgi:hypothetical protein